MIVSVLMSWEAKPYSSGLKDDFLLSGEVAKLNLFLDKLRVRSTNAL